MRRFRDRYGAGPIHLLCVLATFAVAAYALSRALDLTRNPDRIVLWLGGSIVAHDLVLFPVYAVLGVILAGAIVSGGTRSRLRIAALNHLRVRTSLPPLAARLVPARGRQGRTQLHAHKRALEGRLPRALAGHHRRAVRGLRSPVPAASSAAGPMRAIMAD